MLSRPRHPRPAARRAVPAPNAPRHAMSPARGAGRTAVVALPAEPAGVGAARRWTACLMTLWAVRADDASTAVLVVGELAANAVRYGRSEMTVRLLRQAERLHVCVTDSGPPAGHRPVIPREPAERGRGLAIVEALSEKVEVTRRPQGWRVGAVLRVRPDRRPAAPSHAAGTA